MSVIKELLPNQFNNVIRQIKRAHIDRAASIRTVTFMALKRLGIKRNKSKAVEGMPEGSDQGNVRAIIEWLDKIDRKDKEAIAQLIAIDATATVRVKG